MLGLGASGMLRPSKVTAFLAVLSGSFDPSLALVMGGALLVALPTFQSALRRKGSKPLLAEAYDLPTRRDIDPDLLAGAALFGAGWGVSGLCPGPALVSVATLQPQVLVFLAAMVVAMYAENGLPRFAAPPPRPKALT